MKAHRLAICADLLDFVAEPALDDPSGGAALRWRPDHWLLVEGERIAGVSATAPGGDWQAIDQRGRLLLPGFIDTHVHSSQLDVIGAWGNQLLDWLEQHTFPAEQRLADAGAAQDNAALFLDALLARGTTAACVFPTVHAHSVEALFGSAAALGMRVVTGKVLMDRHVPAALRDDVAGAEQDCRRLIERWHGRGRNAYAVTPRFAPTSSPAQLAMAARLLREHEGLYLQTHVAENRAEVQWVRELYPAARSYLDVYRGFGLLNTRSVLAHGIWLDAEDRALLRASGAQIAHSPSSNLFLGSGLFGWRAAREAGVAVSLASDVGGGTSLAMRRTMLDAYKVQAMAGQRITAFALLHAATRGAAQALQLGHEIGSLEGGAMADFCLWDWSSEPVGRHRQGVARDLHERLFAWITLGDEQDLAETWVAGVRRYRSPSATLPEQTGH